MSKSPEEQDDEEWNSLFSEHMEALEIEAKIALSEIKIKESIKKGLQQLKEGKTVKRPSYRNFLENDEETT